VARAPRGPRRAPPRGEVGAGPGGGAYSGPVASPSLGMQPQVLRPRPPVPVFTPSRTAAATAPMPQPSSGTARWVRRGGKLVLYL
jgi:hypothetical protein